MSADLLNRLATQRAACKTWCALLATAVLLAGAIAKLPLNSLIWAAAPILLLGLVEAAYAGQEARCAEVMRKKNGEAGQFAPEPAGEELVRTVVAAMSPAIWPYYVGLFAIVGFGAVSIDPPASPVVASARGGCGSGTCGSAGGCGTSGCGASSGKACSCSSGATTTAQTRAVALTQRPVTAPPVPTRPTFVPVSAVQASRASGTAKPAATSQQPRPGGVVPKSPTVPRPINIPSAASPAGVGPASAAPSTPTPVAPLPTPIQAKPEAQGNNPSPPASPKQ